MSVYGEINIGLPNLATANNSLLSLYKPNAVAYGVKYDPDGKLEPVAKDFKVLSIEPVSVYSLLPDIFVIY